MTAAGQTAAFASSVERARVGVTTQRQELRRGHPRFDEAPRIDQATEPESRSCAPTEDQLERVSQLQQSARTPAAQSLVPIPGR